MILTATITSKGQITLPLAIRKKLKGRIVEFEMEGEEIRMRSVPDVAGCLAGFSPSYVPLEEVREKVWASEK